MTEAPDLLEAGLAALRAQVEQDELDRLFTISDEAARHALARFEADEWLGVDFAETLLETSRVLRQAGRRPSPAVVEAMERCTTAHRAWSEAWNEADPAGDAAEAIPDPAESWGTPEPAASRPRAPAAPHIDPPDAGPPDAGPIRIKVGLGDLVKGVLSTRRT